MPMPTSQREGGIVRINHHQGKWFQMSRVLAQDVAISFALRGLMAYLLSKPDGWEVNTQNLIQSSPSGKDFIYRLLQEGIRKGYMHRQRLQNPKTGFFDWVTDVYESPMLNPHLATTSRFTGSGKTGSGLTGSGLTGSGLTGSGKPGHIEETDLVETDLVETDLEETDSVEIDFDDDDGSFLTHYLTVKGGCRGGDRAAAEHVAWEDGLSLASEWDALSEWLQELTDKQLVLTLEWMDHCLRHQGRMAEKINSFPGFIRSQVAARKHPGLTVPMIQSMCRRIEAAQERRGDY